jgi:serine/threonine protein kinase
VALDCTWDQLIQIYTQFVGAIPKTMIDWPHKNDFAQERAVFMIMPRYPFTLSQLVRSRPLQRNHGSSSFILTENEIIQIALQLCAVLQHIHQHKVVHRDVKLDSILIDIPYITLLPSLLSNDSLLTLLIISYVGLHESHVILGDFGEALDFHESGLDAYDFKLPYPIDGISLGGAQIALAPEILSAQPGKGKELDYSMNDIYALGRVIWDMMYYPLDPPKLTELESTPIAKAGISKYYSKQLRQLVLSLLSVDPKLRPTFHETLRLLAKLKNRKNGICICSTCSHYHREPVPSTNVLFLSHFIRQPLISFLPRSLILGSEAVV